METHIALALSVSLWLLEQLLPHLPCRGNSLAECLLDGLKLVVKGKQVQETTAAPPPPPPLTSSDL